jgi:predicted N-formylglutamate amidohydrolase
MAARLAAQNKTIGDRATGDGATGLIGPGDPAPYEIVNAAGRGAPLVLLCDHASNAIPAALDGLGLDAARRREHIAWDIGAAEVARRLSVHFDAPLILSGYSRLVIDCNRQLHDPTSIAAVSDGVPVPGNAGIGADDARARAEACFHPYHDAIRDLMAAHAGDREQTAIVPIHSFTPLFGGFERPWQIGVLWDQDGRLAVPFMDALEARGDVVVGNNEPYSARENFGYSIEEHGARAGRPHMIVEIRQDLIEDSAGCERWTGIVADALDVAIGSLEQ